VLIRQRCGEKYIQTEEGLEEVVTLTDRRKKVKIMRGDCGPQGTHRESAETLSGGKAESEIKRPNVREGGQGKELSNNARELGKRGAG